MKFFIFAVVLLTSISCKQNSKTAGLQELKPAAPDTTLVMVKNELNKSYEIGFLSRSYSYYRVAGKDTLGLRLHVNEYTRDSTFGISIRHEHPVLFSIVLEQMKEDLPSIKENFNVGKLRSLNFQSPIYYSDLAKTLSAEYEEKYGRVRVDYHELNQFLLTSTLDSLLNKCLQPLGKKVKYYGMEKFHLMDKEAMKYRLPNTDLTNYPSFTLEGMGLSAELEAR